MHPEQDQARRPQLRQIRKLSGFLAPTKWLPYRLGVQNKETQSPNHTVEKPARKTLCLEHPYNPLNSPLLCHPQTVITQNATSPLLCSPPKQQQQTNKNKKMSSDKA